MYKANSSKYITEPAKKIPVYAQVDVLVAGSGPAGIGSALASARMGARTMIVEREFALGGMMTMGLMSKIAISPLIKGMAHEIVKCLTDMKMALPAGLPEIPIDPEAAKMFFDDFLLKEKVDILLGTVVSGVLKEEDSIKGVIIENKSGRQVITGKVFVDATGDGDLGALAGAEYELGRKEDGLCSAPSLMFRIGNIVFEKVFKYLEKHPEDLNKFHGNLTSKILYDRFYGTGSTPRQYVHFGKFYKLVDRICSEQDLSEWERRVLKNRGILFMNMPNPDHVLVNSTRIINTNAVNGRSLSEAMIKGRRQAGFIHRFLKNYLPGFENSYILDTASLMGVRESRRIKGDYILTKKDVLGQARFKDVILRNTGGTEIHNPTGKGTLLEELGEGEFYEVPYRSLVAKGFKNLLLAGRCFSADQSALSATRSIGVCLAMGQAAGTAGAIAVLNEINIRDVDTKQLRELCEV